MSDELERLRRCVTCGQDKPESEFSRKTATALQSKCKACQRDYSKEWYAKNTDKQVATAARNNQRRRKALAVFLDERLRETPCAVCGKRGAPETLIYSSEARRMAKGAYSEAAILRALEREPVRWKLSAGLNFERVSDRAITQNRLFIDLTVRF